MVPAAIPPVPFLSDGQAGVGEEDGLRIRRLDVYRLGVFISSLIMCSSSLDGGARFCRRSASLRLVFLSLLVAVGDLTGWILVLREVSGKSSCSEAPVGWSVAFCSCADVPVWGCALRMCCWCCVCVSLGCNLDLGEVDGSRPWWKMVEEGLNRCGRRLMSSSRVSLAA